MRVTIASDLDAFAEIWPNMADARRANLNCVAWPFQARDYLGAWLETIGAARKTQPFFVRIDDDEGELWMLVPLGIEQRRGARILGFLDGGVVDYAAPIIFPRAGRPDVAPAAVWKAIFAALPPFDVLNLEKVAERVYDTPNPLFGLKEPDVSADGHVIILSGAWEDFVKDRLPRGSSMRRSRRKLSERGEVRFIVAGSDAERAEILAAMIRQKSRKYVETRGVDGFDRPGYRTYFQRLTDALGAEGGVHLAALKVGDTIVAAHWGLVSGRRFYYLMPSTEAGEWSKFSVGAILLADLIEWCYAHGYTMFDLGTGDEAYKYEFNPNTLKLQRIVYGHSLFGKAMVSGWKTLREAKTRLRRSAAHGGG